MTPLSAKQISLDSPFKWEALYFPRHIVQALEIKLIIAMLDKNNSQRRI